MHRACTRSACTGHAHSIDTACTQHVQGTHALSMHRARMQHTYDMHAACTGHARAQHAQGTRAAYIRHARNMHKARTQHAQGTHAECTAHTINMRDVPDLRNMHNPHRAHTYTPMHEADTHEHGHTFSILRSARCHIHRCRLALTLLPPSIFASSVTNPMCAQLRLIMSMQVNVHFKKIHYLLQYINVLCGSW